MIEEVEPIEVQSRTYELLTVPIVLDLNNPELGDAKVPAGNFPAGFQDCEALTFDQIAQITQELVKAKLAAGEWNESIKNIS